MTAEATFQSLRCFADVLSITTPSFSRYNIYRKEKETHIHFECYLYQRCIICLKESVFEMLKFITLTHRDTFHCKQTMCVSHVNGKSERCNASEMQALCTNRKI